LDPTQRVEPEREIPLVVARVVVQVASFRIDNQWRRAGNLVRVSASWDQDDQVAETSEINRKVCESVPLVI
jgi:hypothetical protein